MAKVPAFAKAFNGRWRIVEMDNWDNDFLDLVEEAHLSFKGAADGEIVFGALKGFLDVRYGTREGSACADSRGSDETKTTPPAVADGPPSAPPAASSGISTSTTATILASSASATDFFNSLLGGALAPPFFYSAVARGPRFSPRSWWSRAGSATALASFASAPALKDHPIAQAQQGP
jgi:hypothetical protein